jgi:hypothetical protein
MDHKEKMIDLHKAAVEQLEAYLKMKGELKENDHEKLRSARENWATAWNELMETLMVLERLEI